MKSRILCLLALGLAMLVVSAGCGHVTARPRRGVFVERLPRFEVMQPVRKRLIRKLELSATVEALKKVDLSARVPGVVAVLDDKMDIGRRVKEGEVLLVLAVPDLDADLGHKKALLGQAQKQKKLAKESLEVARQEVVEARKLDLKYRADVDYHVKRTARITRLVQDRAQDRQLQEEAERQLDAARATRDANRARVAKQVAKVQAAEADYELAEERIKVAQAEVTKLKEQIAFATVKAPFNGVITRRWVDPGAIIKDPGAILLTVMEMDRVRMLIDVPQRDVANLNAREQNPNANGEGDAVEVYIPALAELPPPRKGLRPGTFEGTVTRVSRSLDPVTRTMRAEIELPNPKLHLRPGMFGTATVIVEDRSNALTIPAT
jgi:RND family efflux transporter MFP subunit